jgi:hypothetical protein
MSEKYRDCTKEWRKQQEALKNPKTIPIRVEENKKKPPAENHREN